MSSSTSTFPIRPGQVGTPRLFLTAAPKETEAVCRAFADQGVHPPAADWQVVRLPSGDDLVQSGVGKVNAALCVARCAQPERHRSVVNLGICGSLPVRGGRALSIGDIVLADRSAYADEGVATPAGFQTMSRCGFPPGGWPTPAFEGDAVLADAELADDLFAALASHQLPCTRAGIGTVSMCSGTAVLADCTAVRASAVAEAMEGAAAGHAVRRLFPGRMMFAELRIVSNTTGDRDRQHWDIAGACRRLTEVVRAITSRAG